MTRRLAFAETMVRTRGAVPPISNHSDSAPYSTVARQWYTPDSLAPDYFGFVSHFPPLYGCTRS